MAYTCSRTKRDRSIFKAISNRQIYGANILQDIRLIRRMIETGNAFKKVCELPSRSPIVYIPDHLYFNSFSLCYELGEKSRMLYNSPRRSLFKTEEMLLFESPLDQTTFCKVQGTFYANGPYSIGVTADNYLKCFDTKTGATLEEVYLLTGRKFKYLNWETDLERLVVQSTLLPQRSTAHVLERFPTQGDRTLPYLYIAIFNVAPIEFICMLPVSQKIFGVNLCNATAQNGLLIVMYRRQKVQLFSLEDILKNHTTPLRLGDNIKPGNNLCLPEMDEFTSGIVGQPPLGVPVNVTLLEKPCVLFEVESHNHELSFGGYPWHYITSSNQVFHVKSVKAHTLAENGTLNSNDLTLGNEKTFFHPDLSGRILYVAPSYIRCLKLSSNGTHSTHKLNEQFMLDFRQPFTLSEVVQTKSGRQVKQLFNSYHGNLEMETIQDFDYDDELDMVVVLSLSQTKQGEGIVGFYDNQTGKHLRDLAIDGISEQGEHSVSISRSTLVILSKLKNTFKCMAYILDT